jgi:hypothetical protein
VKRALLLGSALAFMIAAPACATTNTLPIAATALTPTVATNFSGGDEVQQLLTAPTGIFLIGTVETTTSPLVSSLSLGGSDGFIAALNPQGIKLWELRLGTSGDDVATAGYIDASGTIWVAGSSAISTGGATPAPGLNRLTVWEVSSAGLLENTFTKDLVDIDIPESIVLKGANFIIQGASNRSGLPGFSLSLTPLGKIGTVKNSAKAFTSSPQIFNATSAAYSWQSYITSKAIKGVTGIPVNQKTTVLIKSALKAKTIKAAYFIGGAPISLQYQSAIGVVELTQLSGTYFITIIHTK